MPRPNDLGALVVLLALAACEAGAPPAPPQAWGEAVEPPRPIVGTLRVSLYGAAGAAGGESLEHVTTWVSGPDYAGMTDNDIRGFLDGTYRYGWNQSTQIHVRVGRRDPSAYGGEAEIFRVLQRWDGLDLPPRAEIRSARLTVPVEAGAARPIDLLVYAVNRDWGPGGGGAEGNNNSAPLPGELWWNAPRHGESSWGLPGAGLASADADHADTPAEALAAVRYQPGDPVLAFEGPGLARYLQQRVDSGRPALLLVKVADALEDVLESRLALYSADHGDSRNVARRPALQISWSAPSELAAIERPVVLEHGRELRLGPLPAAEALRVAASFEPAPGSPMPALWMRGRRGTETSPWSRLTAPAAIAWDTVELRLDGRVNPTPYGHAFVAELADTWLTTGPAEAQLVSFEFRSPSGRTVTLEATYVGEHRWRVEFTPDEIGRWHYRWRQNFIATPYASAVGSFDVVVETEDQARLALEHLLADLRAAAAAPDRDRAADFAERFNRAERAVVALLAAAGRSPWPRQAGPAEGLLGLLDAARDALGGDRGSRELPPSGGDVRTATPAPAR